MAINILCIEDNPDNMLLLQRILESSGYCVKQASAGLEGITIIETEQIDLILLDVNLPDIDGYEVARRIRKSPKEALARIPIIVVTANALQYDGHKALAAGANEYMSKPIDIHKLWERIQVYLPSPGD
jgi:CheY-like chemotaxis protein